MTIQVKKGEFLEKLTLASRFTSNRIAANSILQGILLTVKGGHLSFYSTNLSSFYQGSLSIGKVSEETEVVIDTRKIIEFIGLLNEGEMTLGLEKEKIKITQGRTVGAFPLMKKEDFPVPPDIKEKGTVIAAAFFTKNIPLVLFSTAQQDARPVLTGVNFITIGEELGIVTTDGFRLSLLKTKKEDAVLPMLIPGEFLSEVLKNIKSEKEVTFSFSLSEKTVLFTIGENRFYSRIIEGEFPPFEKVIPTEKKTTVVIEREEFLKNIKLVSVFAKDASNIIICEFNKRGLIMKPKTEAGQENVVQQDIVFSGEEQRVAFNFRFVLEFLNNCHTEKVEIDILRADAPVVFRMGGNREYLHIIMPVRVQE